VTALILLLLLALALVGTSHYRLWQRSTQERDLARAWRYLDRPEAELESLRQTYAASAARAGRSAHDPALRALDAALAMQGALRRRVTRDRHEPDLAGDPEVHLVALRHSGAQYEVVSAAIGRLDLEALQRTGRLSDTSALHAAPPAFSAILGRDALRDYLLPENHPWATPTWRWYSRLPQDAQLVLVHLAPDPRPAASEHPETVARPGAA